MSEAGTLLSDLEGVRPTDRDLVDSILSEMNTTSSNNPVVSTGPAARVPMQPVAPVPSTYPNAADPAVPTAHLIGRDHPTEADFQRMMMAAQGPLPFNAMAPQMQQPIPHQPAQQVVYEEPKKNWQGQWIDELKLPIFVALVVFIMTLPAVNLLVSHYAPQLLRPGGDFNTMGMLARAAVAGLLFWIMQRVVAPLVSL